MTDYGRELCGLLERGLLGDSELTAYEEILAYAEELEAIDKTLAQQYDEQGRQ